jgi:antitoxin HicB
LAGQDNYSVGQDDLGPADGSGHCQQVPRSVESRAMSGRSVLTDEEVRRYLSLPYRIALSRDGQDEERPWLATVEELAGCQARGSTAEDAAGRIVHAIAEWVASARAEGREVPEPRTGRAHSGRLLLRMPQSLHSDLADAAERDHVSLNAYINALLVVAFQSRRPEWAGRPAAEPTSVPEIDSDAAQAYAHVPRLHRFLAIALAANFVVVAIAVTIAVILLISAS